jgi:acetylornithine deacetylase
MTGPAAARPADAAGLTAELIGIDSANPALVPGGAGEHAIASYIAAWAAGSGLAADVLDEPPGRPSVVVRGGRGHGGGRLLLCGHLDTVGHEGMTRPLEPRADGGRLYGRGGYDMKAGLAAALVACRDAVASGIDGQVIVAAVADEEHASAGVQAVLRQVSADAAIVTEPTELEVAVAHKGFVWTEIQVNGRTAHGSRPHLGIDAIRLAGAVLAELDDLDRSLTAPPAHPLLGHGSVHASLISGGTGQSTIPGQCTLTIERRTLPGESAADIEHEVASLLARCARRDSRFRASSRTVLARDPFEVRAADPLVAGLLAAAGQADGRPRQPVGLSYWADSAFLAAAGIPTALFGPVGDGAHADAEWVDIASIGTCAQVLTDVAGQFCQRPGSEPAARQP